MCQELEGDSVTDHQHLLRNLLVPLYRLRRHMKIWLRQLWKIDINRKERGDNLQLRMDIRLRPSKEKSMKNRMRPRMRRGRQERLKTDRQSRDQRRFQFQKLRSLKMRNLKVQHRQLP